MKVEHAQRVELKQGTQEWLDWRAERYTASHAAAAMGISPFFPKTPLELHQCKLGQNPVVTAAMRDGSRLESDARERIEQNIGEPLPPACYQATVDGMPFGASLDGINDDGTVAVEIKVPAKGTKSTLWRSRSVPEHYLAQIAHQFICWPTLEVIHFVIFAKDTEGLVWHRVERSAAPIPEVLSAWSAFHESRVNFEAPAATDRDVVYIEEHAELEELVTAYREWQEVVASAKAESDRLRDLIIEEAKGLGDGRSVRAFGASIYKTVRKGSVNYKAKAVTEAIESAGVNLDEHRKADTEYWSVKA